MPAPQRVDSKAAASAAAASDAFLCLCFMFFSVDFNELLVCIHVFWFRKRFTEKTCVSERGALKEPGVDGHLRQYRITDED